MYPEDRVLVGVINRKRDIDRLLAERWYRIPIVRAPRDIETEYFAFYLSTGMKAKNGGIHYYARRKGHELVRRRDLLPAEAKHPRADQLYYKITFDEVHERIPPILNPTRRPISFLFTTWDRFLAAKTILDLYSKDDWFVERVIHMLKAMGIPAEQRWQDEDTAARLAELRVQCEQGIVRATVGEAADGVIGLAAGEKDADVAASAAAIEEAVKALGGSVYVDIPLD
ncbi:MAG TPA: hypothetical protein VMT34_14905 [Aggregatilineales bacterium]|nr:hypothetical protein [Aggregatilineales bacterium]